LREKPEHGYNVVRMIEMAFESNSKQAWLDVEGLVGF
jgi:hypothetical protein